MVLIVSSTRWIARAEIKPLSPARLMPARAAARTMDSIQRQRMEGVGCARAGSAVNSAAENADAAPRQTAAQEVARSVQPALDGSHRQRQGLRRQLLALALQVAKDDRDAVALGQPVDFFVENRPGPSSSGARASGGSRLGGPCARMLAAAARMPGLERPSAWRLDEARARASHESRAHATLRRSTRNVAWKASWASCGLRSRAEQTRRTIGPWRSTRARERELGRLGFAGGEPLEQLPVREVADRPQLIKGAKLPGRELAAWIATFRFLRLCRGSSSHLRMHKAIKRRRRFELSAIEFLTNSLRRAGKPANFKCHHRYIHSRRWSS